MRLLAFGLSMLAGGCIATNRKVSAAAAATPATTTTTAKAAAPHAAAPLKAPRNKVFTMDFKPFVLGEVINVAEDVAIFRFLMPDANDVFSLPPCSTLQACFKSGVNIVEQVMRFYTPITPNGTPGYFDLIVKKQRQGRMTEHLFSMEVGESLLFRHVEYKLRYTPNRWKTVGMIGGGTGITPLLQVIHESLFNPADTTKVSLLFANKNENKIILKGLLDKYARDFASRFQVHYTIDKPLDPQSWNGYVGIISADMVKQTMPPPSPENLLLVCGPDKMMAHVVGAPFAVLKAMSGGLPWQPGGANINNLQDVMGLLGSMGYTKEGVYRF